MLRSGVKNLIVRAYGRTFVECYDLRTAARYDWTIRYSSGLHMLYAQTALGEVSARPAAEAYAGWMLPQDARHNIRGE